MNYWSSKHQKLFSFLKYGLQKLDDGWNSHRFVVSYWVIFNCMQEAWGLCVVIFNKDSPPARTLNARKSRFLETLSIFSNYIINYFKWCDYCLWKKIEKSFKTIQDHIDLSAGSTWAPCVYFCGSVVLFFIKANFN